MENGILKFGYEDTDRKIEVELYGIIFEINKRNIVDKDINKINQDDINNVEKEIKELIGENSIEKINNKRIFFENKVQDKSVDNYKKIEYVLRHFYPAFFNERNYIELLQNPQLYKEACEKLIWFYKCGRKIITIPKRIEKALKSISILMNMMMNIFIVHFIKSIE